MWTSRTFKSPSGHGYYKCRAPISVGLTRLCFVSDNFLCMVRKSVAFLVDKYDRGATMSSGYGGFYLNFFLLPPAVFFLPMLRLVE